MYTYWKYNLAGKGDWQKYSRKPIPTPVIFLMTVIYYNFLNNTAILKLKGISLKNYHLLQLQQYHHHCLSHNLVILYKSFGCVFKFK